MRFAAYIFLVLISSAAHSETAPAAVEPVIYGHKILETYPHATDAFTQGLFFDGDTLYESTGQYGQSSLRRVDIETGQVLQITALPPTHFGEGAALVGDDIFVLSWREGTAFRYDARTMDLEKKFQYDGEGWGLTYNGEDLVMSDGSAQLRFIDPETFTEKRRVTVTLRGQTLNHLNELEWIDGQVFANVWRRNVLVRIDAQSGAVTGAVDLRGLLPEEDVVPGQTDVLNGVAYDGQENVLYVTGKNWPKLFKIELVEREKNH
ncbi:glutaminyl-peptide cyclotransferase [Hyphococcus sp.]|uniref:glutaminyl-peptide cyclotransferase n=1 Tax=Hyphococcus sp. TaxID=2038636 RepID=UPI003CCBF7BE